MEFENVTVGVLANIYFEGRVLSHTIVLAGGQKKTLGIILPGVFHFGTGVAERMEITAGRCEVMLDGEGERRPYSAGEAFEVGANAGFTIEVAEGTCQYVCSFLS